MNPKPLNINARARTSETIIRTCSSKEANSEVNTSATRSLFVPLGMPWPPRLRASEQERAGERNDVVVILLMTIRTIRIIIIATAREREREGDMERERETESSLARSSRPKRVGDVVQEPLNHY